ncbi:GntR family transcriptional regulator [Nonomuraea bangladeshensis]|uniref:GntR family transcriptional regulator n=1 Tax=Nonomuraea bangladeshensis TaxID=404385 RepID=UPI003C2E14C6
MSTGAGTIAGTDARNPAAALALTPRMWGEDLVANAGGRGDMAKRIAADLRQRIGSELRPGDLLPSEEALGEQYGVSRGPARTALLALKTEGLLEARPQAGYVVRLWDPRPFDANMTAAGEGRESGAAVSVTTVVPSGRVAQLMPEDDDVVCRRIVAGAATSSYYSRRAVEAVPELGRAAALPEDDLVLLSRAGLEVARSQVQVRAYPPTPEQQELLNVTPETPVLEHLAALLDSEGHTLLVRVWLLASDRHFLECGGADV